MTEPLTLNPDRLLPAEPQTRAVARKLYEQVKDLPILSPHGHVPPAWIADDIPFPDPTNLLLTPDHYVNRLMHGQGVELHERVLVQEHLHALAGGVLPAGVLLLDRRLPRGHLGAGPAVVEVGDLAGGGRQVVGHRHLVVWYAAGPAGRSVRSGVVRGPAHSSPRPRGPPL